MTGKNSEALKSQDVEEEKCMLERKQAEVAVRPFEKKYRQLFERVSEIAI